MELPATRSNADGSRARNAELGSSGRRRPLKDDIAVATPPLALPEWQLAKQYPPQQYPQYAQQQQQLGAVSPAAAAAVLSLLLEDSR